MFAGFTWQSVAKAVAVAVAVAVFIAGCASVANPYVAPDENLFLESPSLQNAVGYAEDTRELYYQAIVDHTQFNRNVGVALIGTAVAATGIGITGGSTNAIAWTAVGSAGLFGIHSLFYNKSRLRVYAEGLKAVSCTLTAFGPVRVVDSATLKNDLDALSGQLETLETALGQILPDSNLHQTAQIIRSKRVLVAGRETLRRGRETYGVLTSAGTRLYDAVQNIRGQIYSALIALEPDITELARNLSKTIPTNAGLITGVDLATLTTPQPEEKLARLTEQERVLRDRITAAADQVERTSGSIETTVATVGTAPTAAQVEVCGIDVEASGLMFRVDPGQLIIDTTAESPKGELVVSGGKAPYYARWIGQIPGKDVTLASVNHDAGGRGDGIVTITTEPGAGPATYRLLVKDEGGGLASILVSLEKRSTLPNKKDASKQPPTKVATLQLKLVKLECLAPTRADGKNNVDGLWGNATREALQAFITQTQTPASVLTVPEQAHTGDDDFHNKANTVLDDATKISFKCKGLQATTGSGTAPEPRVSQPAPAQPTTGSTTGSNTNEVQ